MYESALILVEAAACAVLLLRLFATGLYSTYRFFVIYLAVFCAQTVVPFVIPRRTMAYGIVYMVSEFTIMCLYGLIVVELYSLVLHDLKGIAGLARRYIRIAIAAAIAISLVLARPDKVPENPLAAFFTFERSIVSGLVLLVFLITAFLVRYPVPLSRNVIFYTIGYTVYFTARASTLLLITSGYSWIHLFNLIVLAVSDACMIFWGFALTRAGERKTVVLSKTWNRDDEQHLLRQLEAINASLLCAREK